MQEEKPRQPCGRESSQYALDEWPGTDGIEITEGKDIILGVITRGNSFIPGQVFVDDRFMSELLKNQYVYVFCCKFKGI